MIKLKRCDCDKCPIESFEISYHCSKIATDPKAKCILSDFDSVTSLPLNTKPIVPEMSLSEGYSNIWFLKKKNKDDPMELCYIKYFKDNSKPTGIRVVFKTVEKIRMI